MARCRRLPLATIVLSSALIAAACTGGTTPPPSSVAMTPASNATASPLLPTSVDALPEMDVAGFNELLGQLRGTPVVVNVWGSWCDPCRDEAPVLAAAALAHPDVQFLGVNVSDSRSGATEFLRTFDVPYPSVFNPTATIRSDLGAIGAPDTFFYDAKGIQVSEVAGILSQQSLDTGLAKIAPA